MALLRAKVREFGFGCLEDALEDALFAALRAEAAELRRAALGAKDDGAVPYQSRIGDLGEAAKAFLAGGAIADLLRAVFGEAFVLSEDASCYTYYETGDFLSAHKDRAAECAVTVILYLDAASPNPQSPDTGLALRVYAVNLEERPTPRIVIPTRIGTLVVGRGSQTWHERPRLQEGEYVAALTACYSAKQGTSATSLD